MEPTKGGSTLARLVLWVLGLLFAGCQSPTLPLPPPGNPDIAQLTAPGEVTVVGAQAIPGANVMIFNLDTGSGIIMTADDRGVYRGVIAVDLSVHARNTAEMWQRSGIDDSSAVSFLIPYGPEHPNLDGTDPDAAAHDLDGGADAVVGESDGADEPPVP